MTTDQLIAALVTDAKPVDPRRMRRTTAVALPVGLAGAFAAMFLVVGVDQTVLDTRALLRASIQLLCTLPIAAIAAVFLVRSAHPGAESRIPTLAHFPFGATTALAAVTFAVYKRSVSADFIVDQSALACLFYIFLLALIPFAATIWVLRTGAPTHLSRAGAIAGLSAGAVSATVCALPCANEWLLSLAFWHGLAVEICVALGAQWGSRVLRW